MENRYKISYDMKTRSVFNIKFKQGDIDSSVLEVSLLDGSLPINITGETIEFRFLKEDKTIVYQDSTTGVSIIYAATGKVQCILKSDTLSASGLVICEIHRSLNNVGLTTPSFSFIVEKSIGEGGFLSSNYISSVENKIIEWQTEFDANETVRETEFEAIKTEYNTYKNVMIAESNVAELQSQINVHTSDLAENAKVRTVEQVIEKMLNKQAVTIVCYGDSITWGYVPNTGVQTANPYPTYLQTLLRDYYGYTGITVINKGNSGKQSDEFASDTYVNEVIALNPDMIIFMCGINDCRGGTSGGVVVPVKDYKDNIALMVSKLPYPFIFMTPTFFQDTEDKKARFVQYVNAMKEMSRKLSVKLVDLNYIVTKDLEVREIAFSDVSADNIHYTDSYYMRIAEFVFSLGLCSNDISVKDERFISPFDSLFRWKNGLNNYYPSPINPMKSNIYLRNDDANLSSITVYLFAENNNLSFQNMLIPNSGSSPNNSVTVNGVTYNTPTTTNAQTIWKLREKAIPLKYGLNKIVFNTSGDVPGKLFYLIYGLNIIKQEKVLVGKVIKYSGSLDIKADTMSVQKRSKIVTFKDNNFKKLTVKFTPTTANSGVAFGTGSVIKDGAIIEYPLATVLDNGTTVNLYDFKMNSDTTLYNIDGTMNYSVLLSGTSVYNLNVENTLDITVNSDNYVFTLNGATLFTLQKTIYNLGVIDVWSYSINTGSCILNEISVSA